MKYSGCFDCAGFISRGFPHSRVDDYNLFRKNPFQPVFASKTKLTLSPYKACG